MFDFFDISTAVVDINDVSVIYACASYNVSPNPLSTCIFSSIFMHLFFIIYNVTYHP